MNVVGTATETDGITWTTNDLIPYQNNVIYINQDTDDNGPLAIATDPHGPPSSIVAEGSAVGANLITNLPPGTYYFGIINGGSFDYPDDVTKITIAPGQQVTDTLKTIPQTTNDFHTTSFADPQTIQYTTGYNEQTVAVSGQTTYTKSLVTSTANKIADQSNINAQKSVQFIAVDTGRMTSSEDLLIDGSGNSTDTASAILCPFAQSVSAVIPPFCNIAQAGSSVDTTLTSMTTSANDRFVGTDATFPVVLNYNINAEGLTVGSQSSPMIGSASAYLKVHVQEARNSTTTKSEDLAYSETSTASGLISKFSKSMSYQSGFNLI